MSTESLPAIPRHDLVELASRINTEHAACVASARDAITRAIEVGRLLCEVKDQVRHGEWAGWVADHCSFGIRQAQNYMRVYHNREAIEEQMRTPGSHLAGLHGAVAMLAEPRGDDERPLDANDRAELERCEATIEAGLSRLEEMGFSRDGVLPLFAEILDAVEAPNFGDDDAKMAEIRSKFAAARTIMESPDWPPGETTEDKARHASEVIDVTRKVNNAAVIQRARAERDLAEASGAGSQKPDGKWSRATIGVGLTDHRAAMLYIQYENHVESMLMDLDAAKELRVRLDHAISDMEGDGQ